MVGLRPCTALGAVDFFEVGMERKQVQPSTPKAVQDCHDLLLWMLPHLDKLPKNRRYTVGEKLENRVLTITRIDSKDVAGGAGSNVERPACFYA